MFPLSMGELSSLHNNYELKQMLPDILIYGLYPEVYTITNKKIKIELLNELVDSYLLKDVLALENIKHSRQLFDLLKLLAFQVGSEVSINELAQKIGLNQRTIMRYLDLLEKSFVIFRLGAYSSNPRNEVTTKSKYFFYDVGIRNAIIMQYNDLSYRNDIGALWENFCIAERLKYVTYTGKNVNTYFWRNYAQREIDYIEEENGILELFEFKWNSSNAKIPSAFESEYKSYTVINKDNCLPFFK